jgi:hypothetical protein
VIVPQAEPLHPDPETLHTTAALVLPETAAENCNRPPVESCIVLGEIETDTEVADCTTNEADPDFVGSATDFAVIVIAADAGTEAGAV